VHEQARLPLFHSGEQGPCPDRAVPESLELVSHPSHDVLIDAVLQEVQLGAIEWNKAE
jgi:hypothetical protein